MSFHDRLAQHRARQGQNVELTNRSQPIPPISPPANGTHDEEADLSNLSSFLKEDEAIQQGFQRVREDVAQLATVRARTLEALGDPNAADVERIERLTVDTRRSLQELKKRIQRLEEAPATGNVDTRRTRIKLLRAKFVEVLQDFQREEKENQARVRSRVERQLRIVKPDATKEEVDRAVQGGGEQIFAEALTLSTRYGESRSAYNEALSRQQDLRRMEQTLAELHQLFIDMAAAVEQQDVMINTVEDTAAHVHTDTEAALDQTKKAVISAISYRKGRWICFWIFFSICAILALALGLHFGLAASRNNSNNNSSTSNSSNNNSTSGTQ